ncbi:MAG: hypothetical protein ACRCY9_09915 [Phycicoccus sp.]
MIDSQIATDRSAIDSSQVVGRKTVACVREAQRADVGLVVLASRDADLVPALDEVSDLWTRRHPGVARIETVSWYDRAASRSFGRRRFCIDG